MDFLWWVSMLVPAPYINVYYTRDLSLDKQLVGRVSFVPTQNRESSK